MSKESEQQKSTQLDQQQNRVLIEQLKQQFEEKTAEINHVKVDKSQIGQAFIEWGMKVKQTSNN